MLMDFPSLEFISPLELLLILSIYHKRLQEPQFHFLAGMDCSSQFQDSQPSALPQCVDCAELEGFEVLLALEICTPTLRAWPLSPGSGHLQLPEAPLLQPR